MTIKDLKAIAEDFESFWPPGRELASKYICRFASFLKVCDHDNLLVHGKNVREHNRNMENMQKRAKE